MEEIYLIKQLEYLILNLFDNKRCELTLKGIQEGLRKNLDLLPSGVVEDELIQFALIKLQIETALNCISDGEKWGIGINTQAVLAIKITILAEMFNISIYEGYDDKNYTHDVKAKELYKRIDNKKLILDCILLEKDFQEIVWKLKMYGMSFLYT